MSDTLEQTVLELREYAELMNDEYGEYLMAACNFADCWGVMPDRLLKVLRAELKAELREIKAAYRIVEQEETQTYTVRRVVWLDGT